MVKKSSLRLNGANMNKTPSNGTRRSILGSQGTRVVKEEITYESALREEGIDERFVAKKLKDLSGAQERRWNSKKGSWEKFEDYGTQLAALREIAKIFGIYPTQEKDLENGNKILHVNVSAIPKHHEPVLPITNRQQDSSG
jgi:hypothetical protein